MFSPYAPAVITTTPATPLASGTSPSMKYEVTSSSAGVNARYGTVSDTGEICTARWNNTELPALMSALVTPMVNRRPSPALTALANSPTLPKKASAENSINTFIVSRSATSSTLLANRDAPCCDVRDGGEAFARARRVVGGRSRRVTRESGEEQASSVARSSWRLGARRTSSTEDRVDGFDGKV